MNFSHSGENNSQLLHTDPSNKGANILFSGKLLNLNCVLRIRLIIPCPFLNINKSYVKKEKKQLSLACTSKARCSSFLCVVDLRCCPKKLFKNTSVSSGLTQFDTFLYYREQGHCGFFKSRSHTHPAATKSHQSTKCVLFRGCN